MSDAPPMVYADDGVADLPGSRWQTVLRDRGDSCVYVHVNRRGHTASTPGNGDPFTLDVNDEEGHLDLVVQVTARELLRLAQMFQTAAMDALDAEPRR